MFKVEKDAVETKLAHSTDDIRKAERRPQHDRVHGETDLGITEAQNKAEEPVKRAGAV